jgi:hypothetical protein
MHNGFNSYYDAIYFSDYKMVSQELFVLLIFAGSEKISREDSASYCTYVPYPEVVCTVRLAIGFLLVLSKWCAQSRLAIGF